MHSDDMMYFEKRANEERERALSTSDQHVRELHLEFAARYAQAVNRLRGERDIRTSREAIDRSLHLLVSTSHQVDPRMVAEQDQQ